MGAEEDDDFQMIESDRSPGRRRLRTLVFVGIPTVVASVVVLLLGVPAWVVGAFLVVFAVVVVASS